MGFLGILGALSGLGGLFGKSAESRAKGREAESQIALARDRNATDQYGIGQNAQMQAGNLDLNRQQFTDTHRGSTAKQALLAHLLGTYSPVSVSGIPQASGGFAASLQNPDIQRVLQTLGTQAETAQTTPLSFAGGKLLQAPTATPLPKANGWDKFLNIAGTIGQIGGVLKSAYDDQQDEGSPANYNKNLYKIGSTAVGGGH